MPIDRVPPRMPRLRRSTGSTCSARSSSASASSGDWDHPYTTMAFRAEAQIARELMKFADDGPALSRLEAGDVVAWSRRPRSPRPRSSTRTTSADTVWVKFPIVDTARRRPRRGAARRHLDHHALDDPGNRADRLFAEHRLRPLPRHRARRRTIGRRPATAYVLADKLAAEVFKAARVEAFERVARRRCRRDRDAMLRIRFAALGARLRVRRAAARRRPRHRRRRHRLRPHRARPRPRGLRHLDREARGARGARHRPAHPLHRR